MFTIPFNLPLADVLANAAPAMFAVASAGAAGLMTWGIAQAFLGRGHGKLIDRLKKKEVHSALDKQATKRGTLGNLGRWIAKPFLPEDGRKVLDLRTRLVRGGIYAPSAPQVFIGFRVGGLLGGAGLGVILGLLFGNLFVWCPIIGFAGYFLPSLWLSQAVKSNQKALDEGLPDALDLMVVCVEAGLTIDAAMQRVGEELNGAHSEIAREFGIAHMETRIGIGRGDAFKNLGRRTGNSGLQSLAAMLTQAERFGTSIANALQVQANGLRQDRQLRAEEKAAKNMVKLNFPLVLFIFPSTLIVLMGPMVVKYAFQGALDI